MTEANEIIDQMIESDIYKIIASRTDSAGTAACLDEATQLMRTLHSGPRKISGFARIRERERAAKAQQDRVGKMFEASARNSRNDGAGRP